MGRNVAERNAHAFSEKKVRGPEQQGAEHFVSFNAQVLKKVKKQSGF
jgi:hypothetical protein